MFGREHFVAVMKSGFCGGGGQTISGKLILLVFDKGHFIAVMKLVKKRDIIFQVN